MSVLSLTAHRPGALAPGARRMAPWIAWLMASAVCILGYVLLDWLPVDAVYSSFSLIAAIVILVATLMRRPPTIVPWLVLAAGAFSLAAGDIGYSYLPGWDAFPGPADALYLAGYVAFCLAVGLLVRRAGATGGALLDAGILVVAGGMVLWTLAIEPIVEGPQADPVGLAIAIAYPLFDLALIGLLAHGAMSSTVQGRSLQLFALGVAAYLASDIVYSVQSVTDTYLGGWVDAGWLAGYAFWAAAALHPAMARTSPPAPASSELTARRLVVITLAALTPIAMAGVGQALHGHVDTLPIAFAGLTMFALVILRLGGMVRAQRRLLDERIALERTLARQAVEDPLTGLPNRRGFLERVHDAVLRDRDHTAVLFLDLDDFKSVNDSLGHAAGDRLLALVGDRLRAVTRASDSVARLGGDEFAILAQGCPTVAAALAFADRVQRAVSAPAAIAGTTILVHVSVGVALGGPDAADAETLMRDADLAVYRAKSLGRARCELYEPSLYTGLLRDMAIREGLEDVVGKGELELLFQPIVDLATGLPRSCEALVRWRHPTLGLLLPGEFLRAAEQVGAMPAIGRWVLFEACRAAGRWAFGGHPDVGVNVNLSASQVRSVDLEQDVRAALDEARIPPSSLTLEITETVVDDADGAHDRLGRLRALGVRLSIDDFGTGYSSLARVAQLPVTELKLDRSLIADEGRMLTAALEFGRQLGVHVVAEGVETPRQLGRMRQLGCDAAQGYRLARPLTETDLDAFLARHSMGRRPTALAAPTPATPATAAV